MLVYICVGLNETQVNDSGPCNGGVGDTVAACRSGDLIAGWAVGGEVSNAVLLLKLVLELITDHPKSGQPLYSGWLTCPQLILPIELNLQEADTFQLQTTETGQSPTYFSQYKITSKTDSEATPTYRGCLSTAFVAPPSLDSKTEH